MLQPKGETKSVKSVKKDVAPALVSFDEWRESQVIKKPSIL